MQDAAPIPGDGIIGMVQPVSPEEVPVTPEGQIKEIWMANASSFSTGCAGRIVSREAESPDGRFLIVAGA